MLIKMLYGTYGALEGETVVAKSNRSAPFEVGEERAQQLIKAGYAVRAEGIEKAPCSDIRQIRDYSYQELKKMAKELGLPTSGTKEQLIERIASMNSAADTTGNHGREMADEEVIPDNEDEGLPLIQPAEPE